MVRRMWGIGLMVMALAVFGLLPGKVQGAEFDVSKFNQEVGLRFAYGKNTHGASVHLYSLLPRWGIFLMPPGKSGALRASFVVEGIVSIAGAEEVGFELGFTPMLKFSCLVFPSVLAYIEGGAGTHHRKYQQPGPSPCLQLHPPGGRRRRHRPDPPTGLVGGLPVPPFFQRRIYKENPAFNVNFFQGGLNYYY